jgi:hypothetical protein
MVQSDHGVLCPTAVKGVYCHERCVLDDTQHAGSRSRDVLVDSTQVPALSLSSSGTSSRFS